MYVTHCKDGATSISVEFPGGLLVYLCPSSRDLLIILVRISPCYHYFCVNHISVLFLFTGLLCQDTERQSVVFKMSQGKKQSFFSTSADKGTPMLLSSGGSYLKNFQSHRCITNVFFTKYRKRKRKLTENWRDL